MNLGLYISSLSDHNQLIDISKLINDNIGSRLDDASIFYDNVSFNPFKIKCGIFNSTELWNFNGTLITTALNTTLTSLKIVNKIDVYYYYGFEEKISPLSLIYLLKQNVKIIAKTQKDADDLYRKTGAKAYCVANDFQDLISKVSQNG